MSTNDPHEDFQSLRDDAWSGAPVRKKKGAAMEGTSMSSGIGGVPRGRKAGEGYPDNKKRRKAAALR